MKSLYVTVCLSIALNAAVLAGDWPAWRYDSKRSSCSPEDLPASLHLEWKRQLPAPAPAWPMDQTSLLFDLSYAPVAAGKTLFVPSSVQDSVTAYDTGTGEVKWTFFADGPVRFAPAVSSGKVYFVSDDGYLYCLNADTGALAWKFLGGPETKRVLGNHRLVSMWPARGGPVVEGGVVYFSAGIWPFMGIFIHALDAESGKPLWTNSGSGSTYIIQPHSSPAFAGIAPQGYLVLSGDTLLVPGGRSVPAAYSRKTGEQVYFEANHGKGTGGCEVAAGDGWFLNHDIVFEIQKGTFIEEGEDRVDLPVLDGHLAYTVTNGQITARPIAIREEETVNRKGEVEKKAAAWGQPLWQLPTDPALHRIHLKAGSRLYASSDHGRIAALQLSGKDTPPQVVWKDSVEGTPWSLIAADQKLFVVTLEGGLYCFGGAEATPRTVKDDPLPGIEDETKAQAANLLAKTGIQAGYCLVLGANSGRLAEELVRQSRLNVTLVEPDAAKVRAFRERITRTEFFGERLSALEADPNTAGLPPYLASLIVSEDPSLFASESLDSLARALFDRLRPYGGMACLKIQTDQRERLKGQIGLAGLEGAALEEDGDWTLLRRPGALPGSANWTHQYADSANTLVSKDSLVKAPLGLLWFGGPSNQGILPRHGHGPSEQVVDGRLIIEGPDILRAVDVYTGRLLWERSLPGVGAKYDETAHQPGANATGGNYVTTSDGVYVIHGKECLRLDPETGEVAGRLSIPSTERPGHTEEWGILNVWEDLLIAGASPSEFESDVEFLSEEIKKVPEDQKAELAAWAGKAAGTTLDPEDLDGIIDALNQILGDSKLLSRLPANPEAEKISAPIRTRIADYLQAHPQPPQDDLLLKRLNRELIQASIPDIRARAIKVGGWVASGVSSKQLVVMNRHSGEILWTRDAKHGFLHNTLIAGGGKIFVVDRVPELVLQTLSRRGKAPKEDFEILALDARTGGLAWSTRESVFGSWLGYSQEKDILVQAARASRDMLPEQNTRMIAFRGQDGNVLWDRDLEYGGPIMLHGETIITQGFALNLLTGQEKMRTNPLTGSPEPWAFERNYGCNYAVGSECLLTFRSAAAGFFDLERDGGTGNLGGFRSGCTSNLIAANGVLNAPDYTRTCICTYQIQTSLALVHMPETEMWTFTTTALDKKPIRRLGLNLGAPGDRAVEDGMLWLDFPSVGGPSPDVSVKIAPENVQWNRHHASLLEGGDTPWIYASGAEGISSLSVLLDPNATAQRSYTVRLYFAELSGAAPGERVFDVSLQGNPVLTGFDVAREAGGDLRGLTREFKGIQAGTDLRVAMARVGQESTRGPILSGIVIEAEGW